LPGFDAKNIDLKLADNVLTIKGEKQEEKEEEQGPLRLRAPLWRFPPLAADTRQR
jgi:HSP20 family molecular chaperone IbpA